MDPNYIRFTELFQTHLQSYRDKIANRRPHELYAPEDYILSLGGKRIRPLLCLIGCDLFNADPTLSLDAALCVELFHNFSLIHDDILDAAPLRRNQATVHTKWNTNIAILSGDVMLVKAFKALESYSPDTQIKLFRIFSNTAIEVCEGQQHDMNFETKETVKGEEYIKMITLKTAVLLGCSLKMGSITAGAAEKEQQLIYDFGKHLGIAFQLMDDILDLYPEDPSAFGKQIGGDIISNKKTILLIKALELANATQTESIKSLLKPGNYPSEKKVELMKGLFEELNIKEICSEIANKHTQTAIQCLETIPCNEQKKKALSNLAMNLLHRKT